MVHAPAFHVNADDPEAVVYVAGLALEYRQRFKKDVVIDLVGYRRWGHNEGDEPSYTQPLMYSKIKSHTSVGQLYGEQLVRLGTVTREELDKLWAEKKAEMQREGEAGPLARIARRAAVEPPPVDAAAMWGRLRTVLKVLGSLPQGFEIHPKLAAFVRKRAGAAGREGRGGLGHRGVPRLGDAAPGRRPRAALRTGHRPRHLQPAPRDPLRREDRARVRPPERARPRRRALRGLRLAALRGRGHGLRVRLLRGRAPRARDVGGPVRRLHERGPGHHRPVPLRLRDRSGASPPASPCCCPTATKARGRSTAARASSAS